MASLLRRLAEQNVGQRTVQTVFTVLHTAIDRACLRGIMDNNPCNTVLKPRLERKPVVIWSVEETERFLTAAAETPHYALFLLAVATGMRQGEIFALAMGAC